MRVRACVSTCACVYVRACVWVHACVRAYVRVRVRARVCACTHHLGSTHRSHAHAHWCPTRQSLLESISGTSSSRMPLQQQEQQHQQQHHQHHHQPHHTNHTTTNNHTSRSLLCLTVSVEGSKVIQVMIVRIVTFGRNTAVSAAE